MIQVSSYTGDTVKDLIPEVAKLRIEVFREYPFLYDGDLSYEERYLNKFFDMKDAIVCCALDDDRPVGMSTGYPFIYEAKNLQEVLRKSGRNPEEYFCFGESILRKSYRGQGIGKKFMDEREAHVNKLGKYRYICFYTSLRPENDPRRPKEYRPLAPFWRSRGFEEHPELVGMVSYKEIGEEAETPKKMIFWIKEL